ncbi:MAG: hypothetical protein HKM89_06395, partial [Gemmatimonadales bacterium]|nr:hypothetical protein [Gemmatimonadales bacterium]
MDHLELAAAVAGRLDRETGLRLSQHLRACDACAAEAYAWGIRLDDEGNLKKRNPMADAEGPGGGRVLLPVGHSGYDMPRPKPRRYPVVWVAGALGFIAVGSALLLLPRAEPAIAAAAQSPPIASTETENVMAGMAPPSAESEPLVPSQEASSIPTS